MSMIPEEVMEKETELAYERHCKQMLWNMMNGEEMKELLEDVEKLLVNTSKEYDLNKEEGSILVRIQKLLKK